MGELLLELLSEEIPARMQRRAIEDLTALIRDKLAEAQIRAASLRGYVTPRRLPAVGDRRLPARRRPCLDRAVRGARPRPRRILFRPIAAGRQAGGRSPAGTA